MMSFKKREITDYVKDIPMRFSNAFSQLLPDNYLNLDLSPTIVDTLTSSDFNYDFSVERVALLAAQNERERVLKEAEEKLKELELNNKLNETQVKKPIEDVINSSKPIQLTNLPASSFDLTSSSYAYPNTSYVAPNSTVYNTFSYNSNQQPTQATSLLSDNLNLQSNLSQASNLHQQTSLQNSLPQFSMTQTSSLYHSNLPQNGLNNIHLPNHNQSNLNQNLPSNLTTNFQLQSPQSNLVNNLTRSINLPPNHEQKNQLTKNNSDLNVPQIGQQQNSLQQPHLYNLPFSQPISNPQMTQANLSSYNNVYSNSSTMVSNYPTTSIRSGYDALSNLNLNIYPPVSQTAHNLNNQNNLNHNHPSTVNYPNNINNISNINNTNATTNYVPSPSTTYTNGILLPQQHSFTNTQVNKNKETNNNNSATKPTASTNEEANTRTGLADDNSIKLTNLKANNKQINVADFENSSSPFDDALLRSLNDKEELNNVFQQFYSGGK